MNRMMIHDLARRVSALEDRLSPPEDAPKPPTLREQVAKAWCAEFYGETSRSAQQPDPDQLEAADAVLAVVTDAPIEQLIALVGPRFADWLAAQPLMVPEETMRLGLSRPLTRDDQRAYDVRLLRGES